jgi:hypothetical protein
VGNGVSEGGFTVSEVGCGVSGQEIANSGQKLVVSEAGYRHLGSDCGPDRSQNFHQRQLMAERQILLNSINIGCAKHLRIAQAPPTFWILALQ